MWVTMCGADLVGISAVESVISPGSQQEFLFPEWACWVGWGGVPFETLTFHPSLELVGS